jgi:hypothetical protein
VRGWEPEYPEETPPVRYDDKQAHMLPERGLNHNDSRTAVCNYTFLFPNKLDIHNIHIIFIEYCKCDIFFSNNYLLAVLFCPVNCKHTTKQVEQ